MNKKLSHMKNTLIKSMILVATAALITTWACNKNDDDRSTDQLLIAPTCWDLVKTEGFNFVNNVWIDQPVGSCKQDDCSKFKTNNVFEFDEGATKCNAGDPQSYSGTWSLSADNKKLTIDSGGLMKTNDITEINSSKLVLETEVVGFKIRTTYQAN